MPAFNLKPLAMIIVALLAMVSLTGCPGIPDDGRYQNSFRGRGGGWENFRAEAPTVRDIT
jgi:hypothetical protein